MSTTGKELVPKRSDEVHVVKAEYSRKDLYAIGKALREKCPRTSHSDWKVPHDRPDPVELVLRAEKGRMPQLLPLRHGLCCGSLHLFADTLTALREMARVMNPGAVLSVFTFGAGQGGILKYRRVREWGWNKYGLHVFEPQEMERYLNASGFGEYQPVLAGSIFTFSARKRAA
jgi:hypothetical protein